MRYSVKRWISPGGFLLKLLCKCINRSHKRLSVHEQDATVGTALERLPNDGRRVVTIQQLVNGEPNPPGLSRARHASQQGLVCGLSLNAVEKARVEIPDEESAPA